jgi:hypothetical protein
MKLLIFAAIVVMLFTTAMAHSSIYPSVHQLQVALHMEPNTQVPQLIVVDGKVFHPRYLRTEDHFNGEYAVILKLDRER